MNKATKPMQLTGLLLTCERPAALKRMLARIQAFPFAILVLDGSDHPNTEVQTACERHALRHYHHMPGLWPSQRILQISTKIRTEYVLPMSDDDFFIDLGIQRAVSVLASNPDVAAAQGSFWIEHRRGGSNLYDLEARGPTLMADDCCVRIAEHCRYFSHTYYAVHRRSIYLQSIRNADLFKDHGFFYEWAHALTTVAMGKVMRFARPFCIRTANYEVDHQARSTQHPVTWRQTDSKTYQQAIGHFLSRCVSLPPFKTLIATHGLDLRAHLDEYLAAFEKPEENILEHQRHLIHFLEHLFPGTNPLAAIKNLGRQTREREIGALGTIDKGLETLLQYMHYFDESAHDGFPTPYSILAGEEAPYSDKPSIRAHNNAHRKNSDHAE